MCLSIRSTVWHKAGGAWSAFKAQRWLLVVTVELNVTMILFSALTIFEWKHFRQYIIGW